jgi:fatty-acyl-CoA synthase
MLETLLKKRQDLDDTVAVIDSDSGEERKYSDLEEASSAIASHLFLDFGIHKGDRVATLIDKPILHVELFFALRKLGASLVPLNFALRKDNLESMILKTHPKLIFDDFHGLGIESNKIQTLLLTSPSKENPVLVTNSMDDEVLILFTGGSTGIPKGAIIHERSVVWNSINSVLSWGLTKDDIAYQPVPLYHIGGWGIFLLPLFFVGGKVVVSPRFDAERTIDVLQNYKITRFVGVPTMLYRIVTCPRFASVDLSRVSFGSGGGVLSKDIADSFISKNYRIFQGYGATETGPNNFYISPERFKNKIGSVGKPMLFVEAKLSSEGELLIKGPHTFKGYISGSSDELSPFDEEGFFGTGDIFSIDKDGDFCFVGRKKDMIKTGGENVYSLEVEQAINSLPFISESGVIGIPDPKWGEMAVAYVVMKGQTQFDEGEIKAELRAKLASFKIPKKILAIKELPKSELGKVQKFQLKEIYEKSLH